jgi:hypothetical protein
MWPVIGVPNIERSVLKQRTSVLVEHKDCAACVLVCRIVRTLLVQCWGDRAPFDHKLVRDSLSGLTRHRSGNLPKAAQGLGHLVTFLQQQGLTCPRLDGLFISPIDQWVSAYDAHLEQVAGLAPNTRQSYRHLVRYFMTDCFGTELPDWSSLTAATLTNFVSQEASRRRGTGRKQPAVAIRSFLRFLVFRGEIRPGLEAAAPSPPQWNGCWPCTKMEALSVCVTVPSSSSLPVWVYVLRTWSRSAWMISIGPMGALIFAPGRPDEHTTYPCPTMWARPS